MEKFDYRVKLGHELKTLGLQWVKVTNKNMYHNKIQYKIGDNIVINKLDSYAGHIFYPANNIHKYKKIGNGFHFVDFADNEEIFVTKNKCKAKKITIGEKILFNDIHPYVWTTLVSNNSKEYIINNRSLKSVKSVS
jgi:hypothetical protein